MFGFASLEVLALAVVTVGLGAVLQGCIGFGLSLLAAPVLLMIDPSLVPGPLIVATLTLILLSAWRERHAIDLRGVGWVLAARVPGTLAGAVLLAVVSRGALSVLVGALVLLAVLLSLGLGRFERTRPLMVAAGFLSGVMGTVAALGGPSVAVLYQHEHGPKIRATLAAILAAGTSMSLVGLALAGRFGLAELGRGLILVPAVLAGLFASNFALGLLDMRRMRVAVLLLASVGGVFALVQGLSSIDETSGVSNQPSMRRR
jgi:uncharacterized membrane protein YfcA